MGEAARTLVRPTAFQRAKVIVPWQIVGNANCGQVRSFKEQTIDHIARVALHSSGPKKGKPKGKTWAKKEWEKHVEQTPGGCVALINRSQDIFYLYTRQLVEHPNRPGEVYYDEDYIRRNFRFKINSLQTVLIRGAWGTSRIDWRHFAAHFEKERLQLAEERDWWPLGI